MRRTRHFSCSFSKPKAARFLRPHSQDLSSFITRVLDVCSPNLSVNTMPTSWSGSCIAKIASKRNISVTSSSLHWRLWVPSWLSSCWDLSGLNWSCSMRAWQVKKTWRNRSPLKTVWRSWLEQGRCTKPSLSWSRSSEWSFKERSLWFRPKRANRRR